MHTSDWAQVAAEGQRALAEAGWAEDEARRDAVLLVRHALGWDAGQWLTRRHERAQPDIVTRARALLERRRQHEPIAYLTGTREFYGREFHVTRDVLIPRPETELIVEEALEYAGRTFRSAGLVADVGTGSGCLAITLALDIPAARIIATDISPTALQVARANAQRLGAADRVEFIHTSLLDNVAGPFDLIVANLPYVAERDRATLPVEVVNFEPATALFGGADGFDVYRALVGQAAARLREGGRLLLEIGQGQLAQVRDLISAVEGLEYAYDRHDLQDIPRVVAAQRAT